MHQPNKVCEQLNMQRLSIKWLPNCYNVDKQYHMDSLKLILQHFQQISANVSECFVTADGTITLLWSREGATVHAWCGGGETQVLHSQRNSRHKINRKSLNKEILMTIFRGKDQIVNAKYYSDLWCQLKMRMKEKCWDKLQKAFSFCMPMYLLALHGCQDVCFKELGVST